MFGLIKKTTKWNPSLERFPEINVEAIAKELGIDKKGKSDGLLDQPPSEAALPTTAEQLAIDAIGKLRREALASYELELQALRQRVSAAKSDTSAIRLAIGDAMASLERLEREEELRLEPARREVAAFHGKVERFLKENNASAPPKPMKNGFFTFALIALLLALESAMNGLFFAERNEMGIVGGVAQAFIISLINVMVGFGGGFFQRYINLKGLLAKLIGVLSVVTWLGFVVLFNLAVAHFRNALETSVAWDEALRLSVSLTLSSTFQLDSLSSWTLFIVGVIVSFTSFLKGAWIGDPIPGFNAIWHQSEDALNRYSDAFNAAHTELDDRFMEVREELQAEVDRRRADLRSATDALLSRKAMSSGLEVFLDTADSAVNMLLKRYREANQLVRRSPAPKYFQVEHRFDRPQFADFDDVGFGRELVEAEIARMERLVEVGVYNLMKAQKRSLLAFPTIDEIRSGKTEKKELQQDNTLEAMTKAIDEIVGAEVGGVQPARAEPEAVVAKQEEGPAEAKPATTGSKPKAKRTQLSLKRKSTQGSLPLTGEGE